MSMLEVWFLFTFIPNLKEDKFLSGLDAVIATSAFLLCVGYVVIRVATVLSSGEITSKESEMASKLQKFCGKSAIICVVISLTINLIQICLPTGKQLAAIYLIPYTTNTLIEYEIPDKLFKGLEKELDRWIEEDIISESTEKGVDL